ncbi:hypothetical protein BIY22_09290 [Vibrio panuliri]|uniref:Beta/gamma crystallin 'Greek key' domain-containing protein n=1 Tax=Vibrio panuliri TaxID=1381081 RepID=A0A1Q9HF68_9VIBR|nr:beta/gamma crystallin-related protein [Vibrio panuliri]OLQ88348.1 hypothetical protein BIY22_09290 [Vibrio panuliri]
MANKLKISILFLGLCPLTHSYAYDSMYICTLKPFTSTFTEAGYTEREARINVQEVCENSYGEGSIFCQRKDATCRASLVNQPYFPKSTSIGVVIYQGRQLSGASLFVDQDIPDLSVYKFDDTLRSFSIPNGWRVRFYEGKNYTGGYYTRDGGSQDANGFENLVSSVRIISK